MKSANCRIVMVDNETGAVWQGEYAIAAELIEQEDKLSSLAQQLTYTYQLFIEHMTGHAETISYWVECMPIFLF